MQLYIGVFRTEENIQKGIDEIEGLKERAKVLKIEGSVMFNPGWHLCRDLKSMLIVSESLARCALARKRAGELTAGSIILRATTRNGAS